MPIAVSAAAAVPDDAELVGVPVAAGPTLLGDSRGVTLEQLAERGFEGRLGETETVGVQGRF